MSLTILAATLLGGTLLVQSPGDSLLKFSGEALDKGEYPKAIQQASEAAAIFEKSGDRKLLAEALNIVGAAYLYQGSYESARPQFARSLALAREANDASNEIRLLNNLGNVDFFLGRYVPAFATYQAAFERARGFEKSEWHAKRHRLTLANLAVLHLQLGQNRRALELYRQALALPGDIFPSERAQILTNLAICYRRLGDPYKALDRYREAQKLLAQDPDAAASLYTLHNIGVAQALDLDDPAAALATFQQALKLASKTGNQREIALEHLFLGETLLRMKRPAPARAEFQRALEIARKLNLVAEQWTALYGVGRAYGLEGDRVLALRHHEQALGVIEPLRSSLTVSSLKAEFLADKRDVYDAVIAILLDQGAPAAEVFRRIEQERARNLQDLLPGSSARSPDLAAIQQSLDEKTALLDYWITADRIAVIRITRDQVSLHHASLTRQNGAAMERLSKALITPDGEWKGPAAAVSQVVFPAAWKLDSEGVEKLIVVPDGMLHTIPFEILDWGSTGGKLVERFEVWYLPAAQLLRNASRKTGSASSAPELVADRKADPFALMKNSRKTGSASSAPELAADRKADPFALLKNAFTREPYAWPWKFSVAAFANPLVAGNGSLFEEAPRLARAEQEAKAAARAMPGRARLFLGEDNLKRHLFEKELASVPVLHFATHASVDTADSRRSRLLFTPEKGDEGSQYLFGSEIAKLDLRGVELVTLAACESERGRFVRGEGPETLSRAFLGAGAAASVSSLWKVSDAATERLMASFYAHLARGESKAAALRAAKLEAIASGGKPYHWAAFVLTGDGQTPIPPVMRWWWLGAPFVVIAAAGLLWWRRVQ